MLARDRRGRLTASKPRARGRFLLIVRKDSKLTWPRAETATIGRSGASTRTEETIEDARAVRETNPFPHPRFRKRSREEGLHDPSVAVASRPPRWSTAPRASTAMIPEGDFCRTMNRSAGVPPDPHKGRPLQKRGRAGRPSSDYPKESIRVQMRSIINNQPGRIRRRD